MVPATVSENWYQQYVETLEGEKAIPSSIASFDQNVVRGEMAEMIWRIKADPENVKSISYKTIEKKMVAAETGGALQHFDSCADLKGYIDENSQPNYYGVEKMMFMDSAVETGAVPATAAPTSGDSESSAPEYSTTNVQVVGVDEADIVKNDDKYIYIVKGNSVRIVKAYPPDAMTELDKVKFDDTTFYPRDMYVDGERLVVIGYTSGSSTFMVPYYGSVTKVYVFDIKDRTSIKQLRALSYEGNYSSSRKVGAMVYVVVNKPEFSHVLDKNWEERDLLPLYLDSSSGSKEADKVTGCTNVLYSPIYESTNYLIVAGIPTDDPQAPVVDEVVLGSSGDIYASKENLYVAEQKYPSFYMDSSDQEQTVIHKFTLARADIGYAGKSDVPGHILNQFSMDEYNGNFRIATTLGEVWNSEKPSTNNVYILDSNLKRVGNIEGIAPGEKIYSVRFVGDRLYMVTFKKVDPFFVIDVGDPANPKILGKLKIPGYSDYLHPYDENHIIGFGKEAVDPSELEKEGWNSGSFDFAWYQGMKIAMFDVTDVANPVEMFKVQIGDRGTDSPLLHDHKALLFDKNKGIMAFPVTVAEIPKEKKDDPLAPQNTYGDFTYQGLYVYDVNLEDGFTFKGRITHYNDTEITDKSGYYWYGDKDIERALYIGDYLYSVSKAIVKANSLGDLSEVSDV